MSGERANRAERRRINLCHLHGGGSYEGAAIINCVYRSLYVAPFIYINIMNFCLLVILQQSRNFQAFLISRYSQHCYLAIFIILLELRRRVQQKMVKFVATGKMMHTHK